MQSFSFVQTSKKNPPTGFRWGMDLSLCYPHWGQTDRPVCLAVCARGSEPDISFAPLFFAERKAGKKSGEITWQP